MTCGPSRDAVGGVVAETLSDQSDVEGRIHALNEDLRRRRHQADQLKREQKRRSRDKLKAHEAALKKQLEVSGVHAHRLWAMYNRCLDYSRVLRPLRFVHVNHVKFVSYLLSFIVA